MTEVKIAKLKNKMDHLREEINSADKIIIEALSYRFSAVNKMGKLKKELKLPLFQKERWRAVVEDRLKRGRKMKVDVEFLKSFLKLIHQESLRIQRGQR